MPPRILDPRQVPVSGTDSHLPSLPDELLSERALCERFTHRGHWLPEFAGDGPAPGFSGEPAGAAVLLGLVRRDAGLQVLFTQRTEHLREHGGQISFPGGRSEPTDAGPVATALREAAEEVGLPPEHVRVIGQLPTYTTVTSYVVTPVVAIVTPPLRWVLGSFEVAEAFEVPLQYLMTPAHHQRHVFSFDGGHRTFLSMPWRDVAAYGSPREYFIWGATAAIVRNLYGRLAR